MYVLCTNHIMFQQTVKGLFIRSSKLFDSAPLLKLTTNLWAVVGFHLDSFLPHKEAAKGNSIDSWCSRHEGFMALRIMKAGRSQEVTWSTHCVL